ncbi:MAG: hypothetical protein CBE24_04370 [bacterium TMED264]|nr:MAG: hypothetical protein CBE24_04370 [bacterium TMED264]|tara:strand:+ start:172 stop:477 length:306 start_codon:yes stop_codon:yes gene_type:complete
MSKSLFYKISALIISGFVLYGTNPSYDQHETKVATTCLSNQTGKNVAMCPLGYGKKKISNFDRASFSVFDAGLISYSYYENKLASVGFLGNIFLTNNSKEV